MKSPWILVSLLSEKQEFQKQEADDARAAAARAGLGVEVVFAENDPATQIRSLSEAIGRPKEQRPRAIVVETAGSAGFERVSRSVVEAGVGWVLVSANPPYLQSLRGEFPGALVAAVAHDGHEIGRMQAGLARSLLPSGGRVLSVEGPSMFSASLHRRRGLEDALAGSGIEIAKTIGADWSLAGAERGVTSWLGLAGKSAVRPALIVAQNDEMAVGAVRAIQAARPEWGAVPAIGVDGLASGGQRWVREGILAATIVCATPTGAAVELVASALAGKQVPPVTVVPVRPYPPPEQLAPLPKK